MRRLAATCLLLAVSLWAADVTGTWQFEVETDAGSGTPTFALKQEGEKLTGTYTGALGEANVTGTIKGNEVTIEFTVGAMDARIRYTGRLEGDNKMSGKVDLGGQASGTFKASRK